MTEVDVREDGEVPVADRVEDHLPHGRVDDTLEAGVDPGQLADEHTADPIEDAPMPEEAAPTRTYAKTNGSAASNRRQKTSASSRTLRAVWAEARSRGIVSWKARLSIAAAQTAAPATSSPSHPAP